MPTARLCMSKTSRFIQPHETQLLYSNNTFIHLVFTFDLMQNLAASQDSMFCTYYNQVTEIKCCSSKLGRTFSKLYQNTDLIKEFEIKLTPRFINETLCAKVFSKINKTLYLKGTEVQKGHELSIFSCSVILRSCDLKMILKSCSRSNSILALQHHCSQWRSVMYWFYGNSAVITSYC